MSQITGGSQSQLPAPRAPTSAPARRTALWVPVAAALIALVLAGGGLAVYKLVAADRHAAHAGDVDAQSITPRPAWVSEASGCTTAGSGWSCVGVSSQRATQDDAEDEAADAAYDALSAALAVRITDKAWHDQVQPVYTAARDAKLAAFARDPGNTVARRAILEARRAVTQLLRASGGSSVPAAPTAHYWERRVTTGADTAYVASSQLAISGADLAKLVARYTQPHAALGTTVVTAFPGLGWRYPHFESGGAIVTAIADGPLQNLGLAVGYIVVAVDGRPLPDAEAYATFVASEQDSATVHGGTLRLEVIAGDDGAPREFARTYAGPVPANLPVRYIPVPSVPTGGINVWDRYGGSK
jgi:hypothetical protein